MELKWDKTAKGAIAQIKEKQYCKSLEEYRGNILLVGINYDKDTREHNLYPVQIEDFLRKHNSIKDVAVIGLPEPRLGEIAAAIIEVKQDHTLTEEEINNFCLELPRYQRPRKIIFAEVPRNPTGKIEKPKLRKMYGADNLVAMQNEIK